MLDRFIGEEGQVVATLPGERPKQLRRRSLVAYSEDQPRDEKGRWTDGSGGGDDRAPAEPDFDRAVELLGTNLHLEEADSPITRENVAALATIPEPLLGKLQDTGTQWYFGDRPPWELDDAAHLVDGVPPEHLHGLLGAYNTVENYLVVGRVPPEGWLPETSTAVHETGHAMYTQLMEPADQANVALWHEVMYDDLSPYERGMYPGGPGTGEMWAETVATRFLFGHEAVGERYTPSYADWAEGVFTRMGAWGDQTIPGPPQPRDEGPIYTEIAAGFAFDPDQPRDDHGRWTSGGGSSTDDQIGAIAALGTSLHLQDEDSHVVQYHLASLDKVPDALLQKLSDAGVDVYLGDEELWNLDGMDALLEWNTHDELKWGAYDTETKDLAVSRNIFENSPGTPDDIVSDVMVHEIGHAVQYNLMDQLDEVELIDWHARLWDDLTPYEQGWMPGSDPDEFWAETFATRIVGGYDAVTLRYSGEYADWVEGQLGDMGAFDSGDLEQAA